MKLIIFLLSCDTARQLFRHGYHEIASGILKSDDSIRFAGIIDKLGYIVSERYRDDISEPIMSEEDNERYALLSAIRNRPSLPWSEKVGSTQYFLWRNERLVLATIPFVAEHLVIVYFDSRPGTNYDEVILKKILPTLSKYV